MLEATVDTMTETEGTLREEIKSLQAQLQNARKQNETLNECVQKTEFDKVIRSFEFALFVFVYFFCSTITNTFESCMLL